MSEYDDDSWGTYDGKYDRADAYDAAITLLSKDQRFSYRGYRSQDLPTHFGRAVAHLTGKCRRPQCSFCNEYEAARD
jgi:hypothetical protein